MHDSTTATSLSLSSSLNIVRACFGVSFEQLAHIIHEDTMTIYCWLDEMTNPWSLLSGHDVIDHRNQKQYFANENAHQRQQQIVTLAAQLVRLEQAVGCREMAKFILHSPDPEFPGPTMAQKAMISSPVPEFNGLESVISHLNRWFLVRKKKTQGDESEESYPHAIAFGIEPERRSRDDLREEMKSIEDKIARLNKRLAAVKVELEQSLKDQ